MQTNPDRNTMLLFTPNSGAQGAAPDLLSPGLILFPLCRSAPRKNVQSSPSRPFSTALQSTPR